MPDLIGICGSIAPGARAPFADMRSMVLCPAVRILHICDGVGPRGMNPANASLTPRNQPTTFEVHLIASTAPREASCENVRRQERH